MKRRKRDEELIGVILSDCETLARRIDYFDATENSFVSDRSEEGELAYDAIMSPVYRIAEDALHLSDEIQSAFPEYPWNDIGGFRNFRSTWIRSTWISRSRSIPCMESYRR